MNVIAKLLFVLGVLACLAVLVAGAWGGYEGFMMLYSERSGGYPMLQLAFSIFMGGVMGMFVIMIGCLIPAALFGLAEAAENL